MENKICFDLHQNNKISDFLKESKKIKSHSIKWDWEHRIEEDNEPLAIFNISNKEILKKLISSDSDVVLKINLYKDNILILDFNYWSIVIYSDKIKSVAYLNEDMPDYTDKVEELEETIETLEEIISGEM